MSKPVKLVVDKPMPTIRWPWDRPLRKDATPWTRDRMRGHLERTLTRHELVKAASAGDLVSILADAHFQAYTARNIIRANSKKPMLGARDAYLALNQANATIMSAMGRLGIYGASRDPRQPKDPAGNGAGDDFAPPETLDLPFH